MPVISLMTDFGIKDGNVGVMKGVIWGICPAAQIVDLSHLIPAQNIHDASIVLARSLPYFPDNTVHVVVVDPGVGTTRRPMAARIGRQFYVGPDNGTITYLLEYAQKVGWESLFIHLDKPEFWLPDISHVFHGRDIFSPAAAHLSSGIPLESLGTVFNDPVRLGLEKPVMTAFGWTGEIIYIDYFGNLATNILVENLGELLQEPEMIKVRLAGIEIAGLVKTFGDRSPGDLVALIGSSGNLIVSVVNGSALERLHVMVGTPIEVIVDKK